MIFKIKQELDKTRQKQNRTVTVIHPSEKKSLFLDPLGESQAKSKRCLETAKMQTASTFAKLQFLFKVDSCGREAYPVVSLP